MKLFVLALFCVTLIAASEPDKNTPDVVTDESGYRYGPYESNYKDSGYPGRFDNKERARYPEIVEYRYGAEIPRQRLNNREKSPILEEVVLGYGQPISKKQQVGPQIIEEGYGLGSYNRERNPLEYIEGYPDNYGYGEPVYRDRFPDYKYRRYGREGLGFDKRTAYALGLRHPLTPKLLQTVYRRNYYEEKQNSQGNTEHI